MSYCKNCNVNIIDNTDRCPFCQCIVDSSSAKNSLNINSIGGYPNALAWVRKYRFWGNLILFLSLVASIICIICNVIFTPELAWSVIVILALIYGNVILQYAIIGRNSYREKVIILTLLAIAVCIGIDASTGYHGWSINIIFPGAILFLVICTIIIMIINRRNWQSYMMTQISTILLSVFAIILSLFDIITWPYLAYIALLASSLLFLGTLILGDRRARSELHRRFHI